MDPEDDDYEDDDVDDAGMNCGATPDGTCQMAGTEYCDFECPFRDD